MGDKRGLADWFWRVLILVVVVLFVLGFYLLLKGDSFVNVFDGGSDRDSSDDSSSGSWFDGLGGGDSGDVIPAPPTLPS